jgi:hypothetical protein
MKLTNLKTTGSNNKNMRDAAGKYIHFTGKKTITADAGKAGFKCSDEYLKMVTEIWTSFSSTSYIYAAGEILKVKSNVEASTFIDDDTGLKIVVCPYYFINVVSGKVEKFWDAEINLKGVDKREKRVQTTQPIVDAFNLKFGIKTETYKQASISASAKKTADVVKLKKFYNFSKSGLDNAIDDGKDKLMEVNRSLATATKTAAKTATKKGNKTKRSA